MANEIDTDLAYKKAEELEGQGHKVYVFPSLLNVLEAIRQRSMIDSTLPLSINIIEEIRNPSFRFVTFDHPDLSVAMSEALVESSRYAEESRSDIDRPDGWFVPNRAIQKSIATRQNKADEFALKTGEMVKQIQQEENVTSFRKTVEALNRRGLPTPNPKKGSTWQVSTLQSLYSRLDALHKEGFER